MRVFVSSSLFVLLCAALAFPMYSFAQEKTQKVAIMNIQQAIAQCTEGQEAAKVLQTKFMPKRDALEKQQKEISDLQNELKTKTTTLSEDAKAQLQRKIDDKIRIFQRDNDDATQEMQQAEQDAINEIGRKMMAVVNDHAQKSGYTLVLDVSSPQTPVLFADAGLDITPKIIELYNASSGKPAASAGSGPAAAPKPATPAPAAKPAETKPAAK
jgi:outer membrane protein